MLKGWKDAVSDCEVANLAREINQSGYAVISDFLSAQEIQELGDLAEVTAQSEIGQYRGTLNGTLLDTIPSSDLFKQFCLKLSKAGSKRQLPQRDIIRVVRFLRGSIGRKFSGHFHYDSYVITLILPIVIPEDGSGNLLLMKASRRIKRTYIHNLVDKMLIENKIAQKFLHSLAKSGSKKLTSIQLKPGNLYAFWGYRSIHTNEPVDPNRLRATAVFHYGDPHANSKLRSKIRGARGLSEIA